MALEASYLVPASKQRKKMSYADGARWGAMTSVRNGGRGMALVRKVTLGMASFAAFRPTGVVTALMVAQLGASISLIVRIDLGQNLTGTADSPNPDSPKYSTRGFSRSPPTLEIW